jgi:hypothetical protein
MKKAGKMFGQKFACGSSVSGDEITVQGDISDELMDYILECFPVCWAPRTPCLWTKFNRTLLYFSSLFLSFLAIGIQPLFRYGKGLEPSFRFFHILKIFHIAVPVCVFVAGCLQLPLLGQENTS